MLPIRSDRHRVPFHRYGVGAHAPQEVATILGLNAIILGVIPLELSMKGHAHSMKATLSRPFRCWSLVISSAL